MPGQPTPGPWTTDGSRIFHQLNPGGRKFWIAETLNGDDTRAQRLANARLIAAAPELADALRTLHALIQGVREGSGHYDPTAPEGSFSAAVDYAEDNARALLARLDGRETP